MNSDQIKEIHLKDLDAAIEKAEQELVSARKQVEQALLSGKDVSKGHEYLGFYVRAYDQCIMERWLFLKKEVK